MFGNELPLSTAQGNASEAFTGNDREFQNDGRDGSKQA
jgi:hypothetical protein